MDYSVITTASAQQHTASRDLTGLTAVIVKLELSVYGRCSLCLRRCELGFCLKYLDGEGDVIFWGDICETCARGHSQQSTGTFGNRVQRKEPRLPFTETQVVSKLTKNRIISVSAANRSF